MDEARTAPGPVANVGQGNRNLVEFALRLCDGQLFDPPQGDDLPDQSAVNAAAVYLRQQAANYFRYVQNLAEDADTQDCSQDAVFRIWRRLAKPNPGAVTNPRAFFVQILRRIASDHRKLVAIRERRSVPLARIAEPAIAESFTEEFDYEAFCRYLWRHGGEKLVEALEVLRTVERSQRSAAAILGVSPATLRKRQKRIRVHAMRYLDDEG
jgi:DNA-directed RNA polymerase specialized sigma24 family protein